MEFVFIFIYLLVEPVRLFLGERSSACACAGRVGSLQALLLVPAQGASGVHCVLRQRRSEGAGAG